MGHCITSVLSTMFLYPISYIPAFIRNMNERAPMTAANSRCISSANHITVSDVYNKEIKLTSANIKWITNTITISFRRHPYLRLVVLKMKAIAVSKYGEIDNLVATDLPHPGKPQGHDVLIR